jgi:polysaccharide export outer membrane protein
MRILGVFALLLLLAGCLPAAGPGKRAILSGEQGTAAPFDVIAVDQATAELLATQPSENLAGVFGMGGPAPNVTMGVGDLVIVTIFEAASGGLFSGDPGAQGSTKAVSLPPQPVARDGTIGVPYVGRVQAAGLTPAQVQSNVEAVLRDKAIEPQVVVAVEESVSNYATVAGDVSRAGRVPLSLRGDRIADVVASVGPRTPDYETFVRLTRGNSSATVSMARIVRDPGQNIYVRPDDLIYVYVDAPAFIAFGATAQNTLIPFRSDRLTLAEAVARAGGLSDLRADPSGVFVFRYENPDTYALIGGRQPAISPAGVPVIYKVNLKEANGLFIAQRFLMRDGDIVYVSNASVVELQKFIGAITGGLGAVSATTATSAVIGPGQ